MSSPEKMERPERYSDVFTFKGDLTPPDDNRNNGFVSEDWVGAKLINVYNLRYNCNKEKCFLFPNVFLQNVQNVQNVQNDRNCLRRSVPESFLFKSSRIGIFLLHFLQYLVYFWLFGCEKKIFDSVFKSTM